VKDSRKVKRNRNRGLSLFIFGCVVLIIYMFFSRAGSKISSKDNDPLSFEIPIEESEDCPTPETTMKTVGETENLMDEFIGEPAENLMDEKVISGDIANMEILGLRDEYENDDIIGHIKIEGTTIDYPVVQAFDNDYYLDYDIYKNEDIAGWIYMDYENELYRNDKNYVIYGHNMRANYEANDKLHSGERFHSLRYYADEDYYKDHPVVTFNTLEGNSQWEVFTFFPSDADYLYVKIYRDNDEEWRDLLVNMKSISVYDTGIEVEGEDQIVILITCVYAGDSEWRYILGARLIQESY